VRSSKLVGAPPAAPTATARGKADKEAAAYYDSGRKTFWSKNTRGEWIEYTEGSLRRYLKSRGFSQGTPEGELISPLDLETLRIQQADDVHFAGALAGFPIGLYDVCGSRVLVTKGPTLISPKKGECPLLRDLLQQLLGDQAVYLWGWLKSAVRSLVAGPPFRPGQVLAIAGPAGCGKSLLQGIITELLGGRVAKPYRYLIGDTSFNSELFSAEHLAIEDEAASTDLRTRRHFGSQVKNLLVNEVQSFHAKGRQAISLTPFWRVSCTLNDEPENLMVLPPLDESLRDKLILLRASPVEYPFASDDLEQRKAYRVALSAELPAFMAALSAWRIPRDLVDKRYGVTAYQNPELLQELDALAPEYKLMSLIDGSSIWPLDVGAWTGTATELERALRQEDKTGEVARLLSYNTACGVFLGRLRLRCPARLAKKSGGGHTTIWTIKREG
jgi:hypothetical protein